jgi:hypothetical protein
MFEAATHDGDELPGVERLLDEVETADAHRLGGLRERRLAGDEDGRNARLCLDPPIQREAVDLAEPDVEQHEIDDVLAHGTQCRCGIVRSDDVHALGSEGELHGGANVLLVVDDQYTRLRSGVAHGGTLGKVSRNVGRRSRSS